MKDSSKLIIELLNTLPGDGRLYLTLISGVWSRALGDDLAARSKPLAWVADRLTVAVPSEEWKRHLSLLADDLRRRLHAQLGDQRLRQMDFVVQPTLFPPTGEVAAAPDVPCPAEPPAIHAECIDDPELQALFRRTVGRHLTARGPDSPRENNK